LANLGAGKVFQKGKVIADIISLRKLPEERT